MPQTRHILLLISTEFSYGREVILGANAYASATKQPWRFRQFAPQMANLRAARHWKPDAVIGHLHDAAVCRSIRRMKLPTVDFSSRLNEPGIAHVRVDDEAIGNDAARYFLDRGFTRFGFVGFPKVSFSESRRRGFVETLKRVGRHADEFLFSPSQIHAPTNLQWTREFRRLGRWLKRLPKPIGIFAANDRTGVEITDSCRAVQLGVPEEVSVVVVNNDDLLCQIADPPLSSVISPMRDVGFEAAQLLAIMLKGKPAPPAPVLIKPRGVQTRKSSDTLAAEDPVVASALQFIYRFANQPIRIESVLDHVHVSRSLLERKFRTALGRTPLAELRRVRLQRAQSLLSETNMDMSAIALACGFSSAVRLSTVFHQITGQTPTAFRAHAQRTRVRV